MPIRIGEIDGVQTERTVIIRAQFEGAGIRVDVERLSQEGKAQDRTTNDEHPIDWDHHT